MTYPNGYEIAKKLKGLKDPPLVIFVTKSSDYTIRGYEVAFRYLKKPISEKSFAHVMDIMVPLSRPISEKLSRAR